MMSRFEIVLVGGFELSVIQGGDASITATVMPTARSAGRRSSS
jgi:hypothetical protein